MKYKFKNIDNFFIKDHGGRVSLIVNKKTSRQFFVNRVLKYILEISMEFTDSNDILNELKSSFPNVDEKLLNDDLDNALHLLEIYNVIEILDYKDKDYIDGKPLIVGDKEFKLVEKFITDNRKSNKLNYCQNNTPNYYTTTNMRAHTMSNSEYYAAVKSNQQLEAVIAFIPPINNSQVLMISSIFLKKGVDKVKGSEYVSSMIDKMTNLLSHEIKKIRITHLTNRNDYEIGNELIKHLNFKIEAILRDEYKNRDIVMYIMD